MWYNSCIKNGFGMARHGMAWVLDIRRAPLVEQQQQSRFHCLRTGTCLFPHHGGPIVSDSMNMNMDMRLGPPSP